jgi:glutamyl-tRNA synthetase
MSWLGLDYDEGPFFQSERYDRYKSVIDEWLEEGKAYRCYCSRSELDELRQRQMAAGERVRYDGRCRGGANIKKDVDPVIRFKNPLDGTVVVHDRVRGDVVFDNAQLDDLIIARSDGTPTYNFTVVIDDSDMGVTHVIRGDDHLNNAPRQINMLQALGVEPPVYAHLPMILGPDGTKLSKRHGAVDIREYREQGYLPEAMLNFLVRMGWSHGDQEIFNVEEMVDLFDIEDVNHSASIFNPEKLLWINQQHIMAMSPDSLAPLLAPFLVADGSNLADGPDPTHIAQAFHERAETLLHMAVSCRFCYQDFDTFDQKSAKKHLRPVILDALEAVRNRFASLEHWGETAIHEAIIDVAAEYDLNMGKLGQPIRVAVTGGPISPPIDVTLWLVGRERSVRRLDKALGYIRSRGSANS